MVSDIPSRQTYLDSPLWSETALPAFALSAKNQVLALNHPMQRCLQFPGSFSSGRSLHLWLGGTLAEQITKWKTHFLQQDPVPFPIESTTFSQPIVLVEAIQLDQITIIKGLPVESASHHAEQGDPFRNQFLNTLGKSISHDLRAPLRQLNLMTQRLLHPSMVIPDGIRSELTFITNSASEALERASVISAILKEEAQEIELEEIDLNRLAEISSGEFLLALENRAGTIQWDSLPTITGDRSRLQFMFQELLRNALTHVPEGIAPDISIRAEQMPSHTDVLISDNGIGLPDIEEDRLFRFMNQIHLNAGTIPKGMGMGLVRCHRMAQKMKMTLLAGPQTDAGATFRLRIPSEFVVTEAPSA